MNYSSFREKVFCMKLIDILFYTLCTSAIYFLFNNLSFLNKNIPADLLLLTELIVSIILLIFFKHIKSITQKEIYGVAKLFLIINCFIALVFFSPDGQFILFKNLLNSIGYNINCDFRYINIVVFYYIIAKYRVNEINSKVMYVEYLSLLLISIFQIRLLNIYNYYELFIVYLIFIITLIVITFRNTYRFNIQSNGNIDLIKINLYIIISRFTFFVVSKILLMESINSIVIIITKIILLSTMFGVITNLAKESYKFVFKDKIETSNYLEYINRKIINNNYKLEEIYKKLSDNQIIYKSFLGRLPNPIIIINGNFRISYCNLNFLSEIGENNIRNVINRPIDKIVSFSSEINKDTWNSKLKTYTTTAKLDNKKMEVRFFKLNNDDLEYILMFKDLTEEIKLIGMKEELQGVKVREEIKKNFLSNISHDLKIPINVIYSAIQLEKILIDKNDIEKVKSYNDINIENCIILTKLTNNIIDISKIDTENLEVNLGLDNIVEFIEDYLFSLSPYINSSGLEVIFDTTEEEIFIYFDKEMMQRVILNLVSNSVKFTKSGGKLFVGIENFDEYVLIELKDNGIGMSNEFINRAFKKYEMEKRSNSSTTGFGVGLFVVNNLIKAQNGDITIKSEIGKGSSFLIKLYKKRMV